MKYIKLKLLFKEYENHVLKGRGFLKTLRKRNTPFCRFGDMPVIKVTYDFLAYG